MKKFRNVVAAVMAALMVVGISSTALAASGLGIFDENANLVGYVDDSIWLAGEPLTFLADADAVRAMIPDGYELDMDSNLYMGDDDYVLSELSMSCGAFDNYDEILAVLDADTEYVFIWSAVSVKSTSTSTESSSTTDTTTETTATTDTTTTTEATETVEEEPADPNKYIEDVISKIAIASVDGTGVAKIENLTTLPIDVMKALEEYNVALEMTFIYNDTEYTLTIPAGEAIVDEDVQWYGPMWLYAHYGQGMVTTTTTSGSTYTVVSGDNLSLIAAEHDMSLAELVAKNPQITNINLILPGQVINL